MKALVFHGTKDIRYEDVETPTPKKGEVLVKVEAVSICGSDLAGYKGGNTMRVAPLIMGHEFSGVVAALGEGVTTAKVGDKVGVYTNLFCGYCPACKAGLTNICENRRIIGTTMPGGPYDGAMAEYLVAPVGKLLPLSGKRSFSEYALAEPLSTGLRAARLAGDVKGKTVAVIGCGPIGLLTIMVLKQKGAKAIVAMDVVDKRLVMAKQCGATDTVNSKDDVPTFTHQLTNGTGLDIVFDCVGSQTTINLGADIVRLGGKVIWVGLAQPKIEFEFKHAAVKELTFQSVYLYITEMEEGLDLIESGDIDVKQIITSEYPMSEGPRIFAELAAGNSEEIKVILTND
ncbi:MAG TPA: alcohol dehydrogenase catalytic domain-containing protein [Anaerolineaceae bacterium]|nr:alcohol dehydrogenase catalytic domain-containing protein [Anaerolineaceae bacterium]